ncbi:uncharacterized protein LOC143225437 [Tachypleus tridentatus]|uniref:uncharacterized protein LOC143225437 n=1 Tax=Tachypleus tridentatus TaxID=6853 RepID=UPI003FD0FAB9
MTTKRLSKIVHLLILMLPLSEGKVNGEHVVLCNSASANASVYCTCDQEGMDEATDISCYIFGPVDPSNEIWKGFSRQSRVKQLSFTSRPSSPLEFVPLESLARTPLVEELYIKESSLGTLKKNSFSHKEHLRTIILERNEIRGLVKHSISNLPVLTKLSLSENHIQELKKGSFYNLPRLTFLFLDRNNITWIEDNTFVHLRNLSELELWNNRISHLSQNSLSGLLSLRRLDLYKNNLAVLENDIFSGTPRLQELDLKHNRISEIKSRAFNGLKYLTTLQLNHNRLKEIPDHAFLGASNLRFLEISDNHLKYLQASIVEDMTNALTEHFILYFKGNNLQCDCRMTWVSKYAEIAKNNLFKQELLNIKCKIVDKHAVLGTKEFVRIANLTEESLDCDVYTTFTHLSTTTSVLPVLRSTTPNPPLFLKDDPPEFQENSDTTSERHELAFSESKPRSNEEKNYATVVLPTLFPTLIMQLLLFLWHYK